MSALFHASGWSDLASLSIGASFTLRPGPQGAEGSGVYFAEGEARLTAAEGCGGNPAAVVRIDVTDPTGWWRTKAALARRHGRARTWHSSGRDVVCRVLEVLPGATPVLRCDWRLS